MNTLSLLIYLAEIAPKIGTLFGVVTGLAGFCLMFCGFVCVASEGGAYPDLKKFIITFIVIAFFCGMTAGLTPSSKTIYLIAGSELGEEVIDHPETKEIYELIKKVISSYIPSKDIEL